MIGVFHANAQEPGLWNKDFRPLRAPIPLVVIRSLVVADFAFVLRHPLLAPAYFQLPAGWRSPVGRIDHEKSVSSSAAASASRIAFARVISGEAEVVSRALASESSCDISVIRDRAGFDALEMEWMALFEHVGRPEQLFQTFEWLSCWADHFLDAADGLRIVIGRRDGRLVIVWPLMETKGLLGFTRLSWMGGPVGQYGDALIEPGPAARASLATGSRAVRALKADAAFLRKLEPTPMFRHCWAKRL